MIEPIGSQPLIPPTMDGVAAQTRLTPEDIQSFEMTLQKLQEAELPPLEMQAPVPIKHEVSLTEIISDAVSKIRNEQSGRIDRINDLTLNPLGESDPMGMRDLFSLQFELIQLSLHQDFTTKVADKLSQGAQTLFRNQ